MSTVNFTSSSSNDRAIAHGEVVAHVQNGDATVSRAEIQARIARVEYIRTDHALTLCFITLDNGFVQSGEALRVDPAELDRGRSARLAYEDAFDQLWPYFGFMAREDAHREVTGRGHGEQLRPAA